MNRGVCDECEVVITCAIRTDDIFIGVIRPEIKLVGNVSVQIDHSIYVGDLNVVPKVDKEVVLETDNKVLSGNVTVEKIPYYEVSNKYGGNTVIIGG